MEKQDGTQLGTDERPLNPNEGSSAAKGASDSDGKKLSPNIRATAYVGIFAAALCITAPWSISIDPVPLSLATLIIYITGAILPVKYSFFAVLVYILLGAVGLPVFSGFQGGFHVLVGVTGGYIAGYLPCVLLTGLLLKNRHDKIYMYPIAMLAGTVVLYAIGTAWFVYSAAKALSYAVSVCVTPFIAGDLIKIAVATLIGFTVRPRLAGSSGGIISEK